VTSEPWKRLPGESQKAFAAFVVYRDLAAEQRSLRRAAAEHYGVDIRHVGESRGKVVQIERWSSRWEWVERVRAWEAHIDRSRTESFAEEAAAMAERHARGAALFVSRAMDRLTAIDPSDLSVAQTATYFEVGVKLERLARALVEPTVADSTAGVQQDTIRDLLGSDPELASLWGELAARAAAAQAASNGAPSNVAPLRRSARNVDRDGARKEDRP
jgi:hypothetical protein